jgi:7-cyano-7-deazaguanine reductase
MKKYGEKEIENVKLEVWENPSPERDYTIDVTMPEFTCLCPRSGYPDFATIHLQYVPDKKILELKSLKLYLNKYRDYHISHEAVVNAIYSEIESLLTPRYIKLLGDFNPRGNVRTVIKICSDKNEPR